jgi:hypothetical protein
MPDGICADFERLTIRTAFDLDQVLIIVLKQRYSNFWVWYDGDGSQWVCSNAELYSTPIFRDAN